MMAVPLTRGRQIANAAIFQAAWFAAVLGAAHGHPVAGTLAVAAALGWHLAVSAAPWREAELVAVVAVLGFLIESAEVQLGHVAYASGQPDPRFAPFWIVALWALFAMALNVTLRWLRGRPLLAAALGAVAGPASFVSGVHLGGARFLHPTEALVWLAVVWALAMPVLLALAERLDGVVPLPAPPVEGFRA